MGAIVLRCCSLGSPLKILSCEFFVMECMCAKNKDYGAGPHLGSQSICDMGFGFPTLGDS